MKRLVIIGVDGMDCDLIERWEEHLPNLAALKHASGVKEFHSIFPPDTTPAWATIYTGMHPAEHGIINFVNPADKAGGYTPFTMRDDLLKGKTFWDGLSKKKVPVCLVLPMLIYPGWPVHGSLLVRSTTTQNILEPLKSVPEDLVKRYNPAPSKLNMVGGFYGESQKNRLLRLLKDRISEEERLSVEMFRKERWSLFFTYLSSLDEVQHVFWPYFDPSHPLYPGPNEFESVIMDFYKKTDAIIGKISAECKMTDALIVLSDHGHGPRPYLIAHINEWLRRKGYLTVEKQPVGKTKNRIKVGVKKGLFLFVNRFGAGSIIMKLSRKFPVWKQLLAPSSGIDWQKTQAYVSDLSAVKNYSYGGIRLNTTINHPSKEELIDDIIASLKDLKIPDTEDPLVKLAIRREAICHGPFINRYPEILIELDERYGIGWDHSGNLFGNEGDLYHLKPGTHRKKTAVFLSKNIDKYSLNERMNLSDIAPLVMRFFDTEK